MHFGTKALPHPKGPVQGPVDVYLSLYTKRLCSSGQCDVRPFALLLQARGPIQCSRLHRGSTQ